MKKKYWEDKNFSYFKNDKCEYFPCHETDNDNEFNCLFCYCPLYPFGDKCGGNYKTLENGIKDCSNCMIPHRRENYGIIMEKLEKINKEG